MKWLDFAPEAAVRLSVTAPLDEVEAAAASGLEALVLEFPVFRDGRGFSLASVLRERGFTGQLIADGGLLPDQARHLARSGFNAVVLGPEADRTPWVQMSEAFGAVYQPATDDQRPVWQRRSGQATNSLEAKVADLNRRASGGDAEDILRLALDPAEGLNAVVLSSFGAEAAVLLSLAARISTATPVVFLDTGMHFFQTLAYRRELSDRLGFSDVRLVSPEPETLAQLDPGGVLWKTDTDACCDLRKTVPLERALKGAGAVITGRKQFQTAERAGLLPFEVFDGRVRINPLHDWSAGRLADWMKAEDLPTHPLVEQGFASIGCWPCTRAVEPGEDARSGRWAGEDKTECGIHMGQRAQPEPSPA